MRILLVLSLCVAAACHSAARPQPFDADVFRRVLDDTDREHLARRMASDWPRSRWIRATEEAYAYRMAAKRWYDAAKLAADYRLGPSLVLDALRAAEAEADWDHAASIACRLSGDKAVAAAFVRRLAEHQFGYPDHGILRALDESCPIGREDLESFLHVALRKHKTDLVLLLLRHPAAGRQLAMDTVRVMFMARTLTRTEERATSLRHAYCDVEMHCRAAVDAAVALNLTPSELRQTIDGASCRDDKQMRPYIAKGEVPALRRVFNAAMAAGNYRVALLTLHASGLDESGRRRFLESAFRDRKEEQLLAVSQFEEHADRIGDLLVNVAVALRRPRLAAPFLVHPRHIRELYAKAISLKKFDIAAETASTSRDQWLAAQGPIEAMREAAKSRDFDAARRISRRHGISRSILTATIELNSPRKHRRRHR